MQTRSWPRSRAEVERVEREQYMKDEAERDRQAGEEYESMHDYVDRMRRQAEWDEEEGR